MGDGYEAVYRGKCAKLERENEALQDKVAELRKKIDDYGMWEKQAKHNYECLQNDFVAKNEELENYKKATQFCESCKPNGGTVGCCQRCAMIAQESVISRIDSALDGHENGYAISLYDADHDPDRVITKAFDLFRELTELKAQNKNLRDTYRDDSERSSMAFFNLGLAAGGVSKIKDMIFACQHDEIPGYCNQLVKEILSFVYEPKRVSKAGGADGSGDEQRPPEDASKHTSIARHTGRHD